MIERKIEEISKPEHAIETVKTVAILYIIYVITSPFNDIFLLMLFVNLFIFYGPIDKYYPNPIKSASLVVKQYINGIIGLITCVIPKYEEKVKTE